MSTKVRFIIDFPTKTITGTKASFKKAGKGFGPEYEELATKVSAHPDFLMVEKEQRHKSTKSKRTYYGLDYDFIESYIEIQDDAEAVLKEYQSVKKIALDRGEKPYPLTKKWFLIKYSSKEHPFDMAEAREAISSFRLKKAAEAAA